MSDPDIGRMEVLLPTAMAPTALGAVVQLHVQTALARAGHRPATIERGPSHQHSPGVTCWLVTYTTVTPPHD